MLKPSPLARSQLAAAVSVSAHAATILPSGHLAKRKSLKCFDREARQLL